MEIPSLGYFPVSLDLENDIFVVLPVVLFCHIISVIVWFANVNAYQGHRPANKSFGINKVTLGDTE